MGNCVRHQHPTTVDVEQINQNELMNEMLDEEKNRDMLNFKVLCLGSGEAGKSTLVKQLIFVHRKKLPDDERKQYIRILHNNTIQCMQSFIRAAEAYEYAFSPEENVSAAVINAHDARNEMTPQMVDDIVRLWRSQAIAKAYERRSEFWHLEASDYYFENCHRFVEIDFTPTDEDIVMCRKRTTGVVVTEFGYGGINWSVVDVGGQRSERRKWLHCFDNVKAVIWLVSLADYNNVLFEDKTVNRMHESLELFESTMRQDVFRDVPIFLFFNKKDLFEEMIKRRGIEVCFPEYKGLNEIGPSLKYITDQFQKRLPAWKEPAHVCFLAARVRKDVQYCFEEVKNTLLKKHASSVKKALKDGERLARMRQARGDKEKQQKGVDDMPNGVDH